VFKNLYELLPKLGYGETAVEQTCTKKNHTIVVVACAKEISLYFLTDGYRYFQCVVSEEYSGRVLREVKKWSK